MKKANPAGKKEAKKVEHPTKGKTVLKKKI